MTIGLKNKKVIQSQKNAQKTQNFQLKKHESTGI